MRIIRNLLILPVLSTFLFVGCPDSKEDDTTTNIALLYSLINGTKFTCADVQANSNTAQTIPFKTVGTNNSSYIYFSVTAGQKISISSVTTNLTLVNPGVNGTCSSSSAVSTSTVFTKTNAATNITLTATKSYEGLLTLDFNVKPTDLTVQILP